MADELRSLLASFVIEVDKAGALAKGNAQIDALKKRLEELQAAAKPAAKAVSDVFSRAAQQAQKNLLAANLSSVWGGRSDSNGFAALGAQLKAQQEKNQTALATLAGMTGRDSSDGWAGLGALRDKIGPQLGPTRDALNAGRAQMVAAEQAAAAYAKTLRGRLAGAVDAVRAGFNGGGGAKGGGPGLIESLATARNAFLAFAGGTAVRGVMGLVDSIGDISESAARLGVTVEQFQRLRVVAEQNGTSVEALGTAFRTLANAAVQPTKESTKAFKTLGVSVKDAKGQFKSTNDLFFEVSKALAGVSNETKRSALAQDVLGRSAIQLKPIFAGGSAAIDEMARSMGDMNVLSAETVRSADELSDSWKAVGPSLLSAAEPLLKILIPALKTFTEFVVGVIEALGKWIKQTDLTSVAITALGAVMVTRIIPGLRLMIGLGGGASRVLLSMAGSAAKAAVAFLRMALPLLAIEDFITFLRGGDSETGRLIEAIFGKDGVTVTLKAIKDLKAAMVDLWDWVTGQSTGEGVARLWQEFGNGITVMINDALAAIGIGKGGTNGPFKLAETIVQSTSMGTSSYINTPGAYGPPTANGSTRGNAGSAVTIGDTSVTINGYSVADSKRIAADLDEVLSRNRDSLVAGVP